MALTPTLMSPSDLLCKLAREQYRAFHAQHPAHKADHLYNFCITALAIKDFIFEQLGITNRSHKQPYHDEWAKVRELVAATEIANTSKHLVLRDNKQNPKLPKTKSVKHTTSSVVDVYLDKVGNLHKVLRENVPDYEIELEDGTTLQLWQFTNAVIRYWEIYFRSNSIPYNRQSEDEYYGNIT